MGKGAQEWQKRREYGVQQRIRKVEDRPGRSGVNRPVIVAEEDREAALEPGGLPKGPGSLEDGEMHESPSELEIKGAFLEPSCKAQPYFQDIDLTEIAHDTGHIGTNFNPNPSSQLEGSRTDGGKKGATKFKNKGMGVKGVRAGRITKCRNQSTGKQRKIKIRGTPEDMHDEGEGEESKLSWKATSNVGSIIIDLTQGRSGETHSVNSGKHMGGKFGEQPREVTGDAETIGEEGERVSVSIECPKVGVKSRKLVLLDPEEEAKIDRLQPEFQFINYDKLQLHSQQNVIENRRPEGEGCEGREIPSMLVERGSPGEHRGVEEGGG